MRAPLVPVALTFTGGILLAAWGAAGWWWLPVGFSIVGVAAIRWRSPRLVGIAVLLLWCSLGALRTAVWLGHPEAALASRLSDIPEHVQLHGIVETDPIEFEGSEYTGGSGCVIRLQHIRSAEGWRPLAGRVRARLPPAIHVLMGDALLVEGVWSRIPEAGNPGQYDQRHALSRDRIHGLLRVRASDGVVGLGPQTLASWRTGTAWLHRRWQGLLQRAFDPESAGLLRSLLLGDRVALDERLRNAFIDTGTMHLLVVSGSNVGLIALLFEWLGRLLGVPWRRRLFGSAVGLGGYCLLTGVQPPVARATVMGWMVLGAFALDRVISWPNTLAAAALVILWANPMQLFDPGFQLSFGAVGSLLLFVPRWQPRVERGLGWMHPVWLGRYVALSLSATSAVWVGLLPMLVWYFHLVSPVSMLANLLLAPLMGGLVTVGTGVLLLATVVEQAIWIGRGAIQVLLDATVACVRGCHRIPGGSWVFGQPSGWWVVAYYGLVVLTLLRRSLRWPMSRIVLCWVAGLVGWVWSAVAWHACEARWLQLDILDVGHGDCLIIRTPRGLRLMVDAGSRDAGRSRVVPWLRAQGIRSLDGLVVTHPDEDHLGGAMPVLQHVRVRRLLTNGVWDDTMSARQLRQITARQRIPLVRVVAGMVVQGDPDVRIEVLHPPHGLVPGVEPASNDNSVVLKLTKGTVSLLLCGDIEEAGVPWLLRAAGASLRSTVLKVPHHGSRLGEVGERLFAGVHPTVAVLSVGRLHHLPVAATIHALEHTGAALYSTREQGAIRLRTDGRTLQVQTFRARKWRTLRSHEE